MGFFTPKNHLKQNGLFKQHKQGGSELFIMKHVFYVVFQYFHHSGTFPQNIFKVH